MGISASRVDKYYKCPFQYFCKFGIKAQPRKTAKLDPASSGTVIHYVLENLLREYRGDKIHDLIALSPEDRHKKVDRYLDLYLDTQMDGTEGKSARFSICTANFALLSMMWPTDFAKNLLRAALYPVRLNLKWAEMRQIFLLTGWIWKMAEALLFMGRWTGWTQ